MDTAVQHSAAVDAVGLVRRFGDVIALDHVSLSIGRGEFYSLLGPSGCGKTTFLRIVAPLDASDEGSLSSGGNYSLIGGFWGAVFPVQQAGGPTLFIANLQNGSVKVTWLPNTPDFVLQEAGTLNPTPVAWTNAPAAYTNGATIPASPNVRYFRLLKP